MNILDIYPELTKNRIFRDAAEQNILKFITPDSFEVREFSAGEEICSPLSRDIPLSFIIEGRAVVNSADGGRNVILKTASSGALFGIATLYSADDGFPTKVRAKTNCRVLFISASAVRELVESDTGAMRGLMEFLSNRIVYLNKKISAFTAGSAERRLSLFLAENETDGVFYAETSMSALADMLDIGRASLYRALDRLENEGLIERQEKTVLIKDKKLMLEKYFG